jgi:hypothetical protein
VEEETYISMLKGKDHRISASKLENIVTHPGRSAQATQTLNDWSEKP